MSRPRKLLNTGSQPFRIGAGAHWPASRRGGNSAEPKQQHIPKINMSTILTNTLLSTSLASVEPIDPAIAITDQAWAVAKGERTGSDEGFEIVGAKNDYNCKGNGSTMARRVLRNGSWEWVSAPASRGRFLAGDRKDVQHGTVYEGEIVATYTLGGSKTPTAMTLARGDEKCMTLDFKKIKTGYRLTRTKTGESIDVTDPYWK